MCQQPSYSNTCVGQAVRHHVWLGNFGAASPKPIHMYAVNAQWVAQLAGPLRRGRQWQSTVSRYVGSDGRIRCTGNRHLKRSQFHALCFRVACEPYKEAENVYSRPRCQNVNVHLRRYPGKLGHAVGRLVMHYTNWDLTFEANNKWEAQLPCCHPRPARKLAVQTRCLRACAVHVPAQARSRAVIRGKRRRTTLPLR